MKCPGSLLEALRLEGQGSERLPMGFVSPWLLGCRGCTVDVAGRA